MFRRAVRALQAVIRAVQAPPLTPPPVGTPPEDLLAWAKVVDVSRMTEHTAKVAADYLRDFRRMRPTTAREYGVRLANLLETQVSPPPPISLTAEDLAATVLAVRRKQLGVEAWPGWPTWPGRSEWTGWADWPGWNRGEPASP